MTPPMQQDAGAAEVWQAADPARLTPLYREALDAALGSSEGGLKAAGLARSFGQLEDSLGHRDEARRLLEQSVDLYARALGDEHVEVAAGLELLAGIGWNKAGNLRRALEIREKLEAAPELGRLLVKMAGEGIGDAENNAVRGARMLERMAPGDPLIGVGWNEAGARAEGREAFVEAEAHYRKALAVSQRVYGARHPEVGTTMNNLAGVVGAQGRLQEAERLLRAALPMLRETLGASHLRTAACSANLGDLLGATGRSAEARRYLEAALAAYRELADREGVEAAVESLRRLR